MKFLISDTFTDSLARLTGDEQKTVTLLCHFIKIFLAKFAGAGKIAAMNAPTAS
jgi:hypothetical protein